MILEIDAEEYLKTFYNHLKNDIFSKLQGEKVDTKVVFYKTRLKKI